MALIGMREVSWGFDQPPLLENISFNIEKGERVCLLGRNGAGKSTFLRLLNGEILPDQGEVWRQQGVTVGSLKQEIVTSFEGSIFDLIAHGAGETGKMVAEYNRLNKMPDRVGISDSNKKCEQLHRLQDMDEGWALFTKIESLLSQTGLDPESRFEDLSAGMKRRALFARAVAQNPDVLLLDEPTNHFDIESVLWMEEFILRYIKTLVFVTHDRVFLKNIATRVLELDRGVLTSHACDFDTYLKRKQAALDAEEKQNRQFDKKLSQEEAWIRQGVKARRTRNEGRVKVLEKMRKEFWARRKKIGNVNMQVQESQKTGKLVIEAKNVSFSHGRIPILKDFSTVIMRGEKVGIIGPNGVGKTTLLSILLEKTPPDAGNVRHGTSLQTAYFDQLRMTLDENKTVVENIAEGNDYIVFNGEKRHVISHLKNFLFSPQRCRMPVHVLSGGEKNRLLLAKLFTQPFNVLVLDEPTNDLDIETLELLEELLFEFSGTILIVSHDRAFLNNVVTSTMVFEGNGEITQYPGGYDDWLLQKPKSEMPRLSDSKAPRKSKSKPKAKQSKATKLTFKENLELNELPQKIDTLETIQKEIFEIMSEPSFYKKEKNEIARVKNRLEETEKMIEKAYIRWEVLEEKSQL